MATIKDLAEQYGVAKAQDQNENLGKLAEMLGSARDIGNEYKVPSWVPLAGGTGAGDLLMGRTPEEIENWSYGNAPMQIPEMSNVPQFKRGRAQSLADALTTLAPGVKATEGLPVGMAIKGYHGTPHLFDRFDMSKLGTGEGAQAYGHGIYLAQDPSIAESYRKNLSRDADIIYQVELNGVPVDLRSLKGAPNLALASMVSEPNRPIDDIIKTYREGDHSKPYAKLWPDVANFLEENRNNIKIYDEPIKHTGKIYETSIQWPNAEREAMDPLGEHHLLDWDRPAEGYVKEAIPRKIRELQNARDAISSKYVDDEFNPDDLFSNTYSFPSNEDKAAMDKIAEEIVMHKNMSPAFEKGAEGRTTYYKLEKMLGSPEKASEYLHSLDIPGIKYLDATSRGTDKGTRNFVTFGDEYPQIVKRAGSLDELQEKNLNKRLIEKYLSEGKLSPNDMAQYEQNALAMETPLLQRYNVANAEMQIPNTKQRAKSLGFMTQPSKEQYHLTRNDWENNIPDLTKSDLGFHTGSIDQANYRGKAFDDNAVGQSVIPIAPHKYTNYLKLNDLGSFHADSIAPQLEKKKILAKGKAKQIQSAIDNDWKLTDQYDQQMRDVLSQHDIDAIKYANEQEGEGLSYAHINPSMIRSRFAAFDPLRKNSSSIMASGLLGDLALKYANDEDQGYAEGGIVDKLKSQDFGPNDSVIISSLMHPQEAAGKAGDWLQEKMRIASGRPYEDNFTPDQQAQAGLDLAGLMQTGAMPFAPASAGGTLGTFIGPKSRNWDKVAAELAAKKLDEGADPAEVWREHLIGRMPDKTLFSEISDYPASFKGIGSFGDVVMNRLNALQNAGKKTIDDPMNVADIFMHRDLAESYPELFPSTEVRFLSKDNKSKGSMQFMDDGTNILKMPYDARRGITSTMLHELQHGIQRDEGWGQGGNLDSAASFYIENYLSPKLKGLNNSINEGTKLRGNITNEDEYAANVLRHKQLVAEREKLNDEVSNIENNQAPKLRLYNRLAGEAQARATQDRLDMDMAQRRENYPLAGGKLSDIPLEELIYKYEGNGPSLSADPLSKYKDYVGEHSAPLGDSGAPLHNLTANENAIYPSDVYSSQANQYYGSGEPEDAQLFAMAQRLKDKPNEKVSIYRAVPKMQSNSEKAAQLEKDLANYMKRGRMPSNSDFNNKSDWYEWASNERDRLASLPEETLDPLSINHGDWVALDKKYAKEHGESALGGNYKILSKKVPARQLFTNGDSIREWGWDSRYAQGGQVDKDSLQLNKPQRTPSHPDKSHIVKTMVDGKEKIIRFGEQGAETAGKPKEGESDRMTAKRESFKARHAKNIAKGPSSAAYWANKVKWAEGGEVDIRDDEGYADDLARLKRAYENSNFGPNDSMIASTIHHPIEAAKRAKDSLMRSIDTAAGVPREILDESSAFPFGVAPSMDEQAQAALDLAGLAQTGAMPFAPESAGGTLGMLIKPMKASEAYGRIEGQNLNALETDRSKVGKGFLGGVGYTGLQHTSPPHAEVDSTWGVQTPSKAATIINGTVKPGQPDPVFTTFIGSPDQHRSNNLAFDLVHKTWRKALKDSDLLTPELIERMNERLATHKDYVDRKTGKPIFPADINVLSKNLKDYATTFDRRAALAEVLGGKGVGGKKGQIFDYDKVIRDTTDPALLDVPTGALGNRLFTLNGGILTDRYDLNPAFPTILQGKDFGLIYEPVPRELVFKDFVNDIRQKTGRDPGYMHWTRGYPPSQLITEDLLTEMQRAGYAKGGEVKDLHNKYEESDYGYGNRPDKTKKGLGYFGELERPDGTGVMTEYSIGVPIHGEEMDVPTLVPTLTPDEIRLILHMQDGDDMPRSIVHKAIDHAHQRLSEGKPIFATEEDLYAHGGIVDVLHNDAIEQIMKAFMDSMADDEEPSAPAVSIEITTQNTETPQRGKIPKSIAREAKHG